MTEPDVKILSVADLFCTECHRRTNAGEEIVMFWEAGLKFSRWLCPDCMPNASEADKLRLIKHRMTT